MEMKQQEACYCFPSTTEKSTRRETFFFPKVLRMHHDSTVIEGGRRGPKIQHRAKPQQIRRAVLVGFSGVVESNIRKREKVLSCTRYLLRR